MALLQLQSSCLHYVCYDLLMFASCVLPYIGLCDDFVLQDIANNGAVLRYVS